MNRRRLTEAIPLYEATLTSQEQALGKDHTATLALSNYLAYTYQTAGRLTEGNSAFRDDPRRVRTRAEPRPSTNPAVA